MFEWLGILMSILAVICLFGAWFFSMKMFALLAMIFATAGLVFLKD